MLTAGLGLVGTADAGTPKRVSAPSARADSNPLVRIRGIAANAELTPLQFAYWLQLQPPSLLEATGIANLRRVSLRTELLKRTSADFREADVDNSGRVSAREIASFLASRAARMSHV